LPLHDLSLSRAGLAWLGVAVLLGAGALLAWPIDPALLDWQPALAGSQPWRAWSAALVHLSALHLGANLAGTVLVGVFGLVAAVPPRMAGAWLLAWPLTQLGLLFRPGLAHYAGLSGVLHAGVAVVALWLVLEAPGWRRLIGAAVLVGVTAKVLSETPWGPLVRHPPGWDIGVAPLAHATGLIAGLCCAGLVCLAHRSRRRRRGLDGPGRRSTASQNIDEHPAPRTR
jgi:rhomboid family GlyGly-CTERM serine protease